MSTLQITPISGALGAEVTGIDLAAPINEALQAELDAAFYAHLVLSFPGQQLNARQLLELTQSQGGVGETPYLTGLPDYPDVVPIIKEATEKSAITFGAGWHTDFTFQSMPPSRTLLYAVDVPVVGGDTLYSNLYTAYDALSTGMQEVLENMTAVHSATRSYGPQARMKDQLESMTIVNAEEEPGTITHPVIRTHPVTGRKALWINPVYTLHFSNMTLAESAPLLKYLNDLAVSPSFTCRVRWHPGTLTMWDNRCTQHCATADYHGQRREMLRTTVAGDVPR
ncbi:MAG: TauD/TfdA family dioxygenase [Pseudomonadales bacterium]|jgi:taurine dioxygenase|nr:TauD/TfdA family dioxygenase [Pseudomonadales bacterium]MDP4911172.1 TauD/TfdA family dioxygenase [Pseudomonadales bacterium]